MSVLLDSMLCLRCWIQAGQTPYDVASSEGKAECATALQFDVSVEKKQCNDAINRLARQSYPHALGNPSAIQYTEIRCLTFALAGSHRFQFCWC